MIDFKCPKCHEMMSVPDSLAGHSDTCPSCGHVVIVPRPIPAVVGPAATAPQPAAPQPAQVILRGSKAMNGFGLVAILLGVLACITCWIPLFGVVSLPLSGLGLLFGVIGFIVSITGKRSAMSLPIAGTVVCAVAIIIALYPIFFLGAAVTAAAHEATRKSTAGSDNGTPSRTPARRRSPALPPGRPPSRGFQRDKARRDAEIQKRLDARKAAADEEVRRERIEAHKRAEIERIRREEARAKLLPRFRAATNEHGVLLVRNNLQAWGTALQVTTKDANRLTFRGSGVDAGSLPPRNLKFSGRVDEHGHLILDLSNQSGTLRFDKFLDTGMFSMKKGGMLSVKKGGHALIPLNATMRQEILKRRQEVARILKQQVPEPKITLYDQSNPSDFRKVGKMKFSFAAAEVNVCGSRGTPRDALNWVDGSLDTWWGRDWPSTTGTYSVRYKERPKTRAIGILAHAYDRRMKSLGTASLTINGQRRVLLPSLEGRGRAHEKPKVLIELRFTKPIELVELRFDVLDGTLALHEILMVE